MLRESPEAERSGKENPWALLSHPVVATILSHAVYIDVSCFEGSFKIGTFSLQFHCPSTALKYGKDITLHTQYLHTDLEGLRSATCAPFQTSTITLFLFFCIFCIGAGMGLVTLTQTETHCSEDMTERAVLRS